MSAAWPGRGAGPPKLANLSLSYDTLSVVAASNPVLGIAVRACGQKRYDLIGSERILVMEAERQANPIANMVSMFHCSSSSRTPPEPKSP